MQAITDAAHLIAMLEDSRARTLELVAGLGAERLIGPQRDIVNPLLWEIGHLAWPHEHFILRALDGVEPAIPEADAIYKSAVLAHDERWVRALPPLDVTLDYMGRVHDALVRRLAGTPTAEEAYRYRLTTYHEHMHGEAFTYSRQTLGYPAPAFAASTGLAPVAEGPWPGDAAIPGGTFRLGADPGEAFVFDNEKWAHPVDVAPLPYRAGAGDQCGVRGLRRGRRLSRPVVLGRGRLALALPDRGRAPRALAGRRRGLARPPVRWVGGSRSAPAGGPCQLVRGRRLPTEAEWEAAASTAPTPDGGMNDAKTRYSWGEDVPDTARANLDGGRLGCVDVAAHAEGDSALGCRQMLGNVWEWTASDFLP